MTPLLLGAAAAGLLLAGLAAAYAFTGRSAAADTLKVKVASRHDFAPDLFSLTLTPVEGQLPAFTPGAHVEVHLPKKLSRPYSLCGDPADTGTWRLGVKVEAKSRGGSLAMQRVQVGDVLEVHLAKNLFPLQEDAPALLVAGGIGITPLLAMAYRLRALGRPFHLHYAVRSPVHAAFAEEAARQFPASFMLHVDSPEGKPTVDFSALVAGAEPDAHLYTCGPRGFMDAAMDAARAAGWPAHRIHHESFSPPAPKKGDQPFEVVLAKAGKSFTVPPDQGIVDVLEANGVEIPVGCHVGACGTCQTKVLEGIPDHRDDILEGPQRQRTDVMYPCVSRCKSPRLVLDL